MARQFAPSLTHCFAPDFAVSSRAMQPIIVARYAADWSFEK
jgi:hypothetical protein